MADVTIREYRPDDAGALARLFNKMRCAAGGHSAFVPDEIQALVRGLVRDVRRDSRVIFSSDSTLVAGGLVTTPPDGGFRIHLWGGVDPDHLARGFGRALFDWQLSRALEIHRATAPRAGWQVESSTVLGDRARERMLERAGMRPVRYYLEMVGDTGQPAPPLPPGLRSVGYRSEFASAVCAAHAEAFRDHWGYQLRPREEWLAMTVGSDSFRPELSRVAFDGNEIAGYLFSYHDAVPDRLHIGHVGTRRPWRRRGLASALLGETLAAAHEAGLTTASLGVDADSLTGAVGLYEKAGFRVAYRAVGYSMPLLDANVVSAPRDRGDGQRQGE